jgi:hypothetical protein
MLINWQSQIKKKYRIRRKVFHVFELAVYLTHHGRKVGSIAEQCRSSVTVRPICNTRAAFNDKGKKDSTWGILLPAATIYNMAET